MTSPLPTIEHDHTLGAEALNRRAIARFSQGDPAGALDDFSQAVALAPGYAEAWNNSGLVRQVLGRLGEALADFDQALAARPDYPEALTNRGRARQALGDLAGARADLDWALACASGPFVASVLHNRAALRQAQGDLAAALADLNLALRIDPEHTASYVCRGLARKEAGDLSGARADLDAALERAAPHNQATVYHARGGVRVLQNDFAGAIADYDQAIALEPENHLYYLSRGNARYHRRDVRGAVDFRMAFRLDPEGTAREVARLLAADTQRDAAAVLDNCDKHLRLSDRDALAHARRGLTLLLVGREAEAARDLARFRALVPDLAPLLARVIDLAREHRDSRRFWSTGARDTVFTQQGELASRL
jgi:serine/threonine-protein kinase